MSDTPISGIRLRDTISRIPQWLWIVSIAGVVFVMVSRMILSQYPDAELHFRIDFSRLLLSPLVLKVHIASALAAFFIGCWILARPKGRGMHKTLGWIWVAAMGLTAVSSFWLTGLNGQSFSWIHGLSAWTVIGLPMGIYAVRKKQIKKHAKSMTGMFLGGMVIAGLFTFLPGRTMWHLFFTI